MECYSSLIRNAPLAPQMTRRSLKVSCWVKGASLKRSQLFFLCDSNHTTFWKGQKMMATVKKNKTKKNSCQGLGRWGRRTRWGARDMFRAGKQLCITLWWGLHVIVHLSRTPECAAQVSSAGRCCWTGARVSIWEMDSRDGWTRMWTYFVSWNCALENRMLRTSLVVQWLGLWGCSGHSFDSWSGNCDPTCCAVQPNEILF